MTIATTAGARSTKNAASGVSTGTDAKPASAVIAVDTGSSAYPRIALVRPAMGVNDLIECRAALFNTALISLEATGRDELCVRSAPFGCPVLPN